MSSYTARRASRRDANEPAFIAAAKAVGGTVIQLDEIDLAIGFDGVTYLLEVKNPEYPKAHPERRARQAALRDGWAGGPIGEVETVDEMLRFIGAKGEAKP